MGLNHYPAGHAHLLLCSNPFQLAWGLAWGLAIQMTAAAQPSFSWVIVAVAVAVAVAGLYDSV